MSALVLSAVAFAQPILTSNNSNPVVGEIFSTKNGSWISEGGSGPNQTWNFTSITIPTLPITYTFQNIQPSSMSLFPNANLERVDNSNSFAMLLNTSPTALQFYGLYDGTNQVNYSDPEDQMRYPFTMGSNYHDIFKAHQISGPYTYFRKGSTTVSADAYGTLLLPGATYTNVLRIHTILNYDDSTNFGGSSPYIENSHTDMYSWYLPNIHMAIFSVYTQKIGINPITKGSTILQSVVNSIGELQAGIKSINLYPNPANGEAINMDLNLEKNLSYEIVVMDNLGREVLKTEASTGLEGYNFRSVNISGIESGLYQVVLKSEGRSLKSTKIVVAR